MRIIAGKLKGREIRTPRGSRMRPVTGAVLEQLMNLFTTERLIAGPFLDLCAGSGLVGLEATSRGAPLTVFVEVDRRSASHLKQLLSDFDLVTHTHVISTDVRRCATVAQRHMAGAGASCCMLDPPFIKGMAHSLLMAVSNHPELIDPAGLLICRSPDELPDQLGCLSLLEKRNAGNAHLWLYHPTP